MINFLTGLALVGAAASAIACAIAKLIIENGKCRIEDHSQFLARQSHLTAVVSAKAVGDGGSILHSKFSINGAAFVFFAAIATLFAQKTNSPPRGGSVELRVENEKCRVESVELRSGQSYNSTLSIFDSQLPFRLESVTTNDSHSYTMPTNGTRYDKWWKRGAYEDVFCLDLDGMSFPLNNELLDSLWVYSWGMAGAHLGNPSNRLIATGVPMSAVPGLSQFWSEGADCSCVLTWQDFSLNRDTNTPVSAQLELYPNGDFIARSNNVERLYRRVNPDDWDDDGIPNTEDDEPLIASEPAFGPHQELPQGANTNAYYWVDIVVSNACSLVTFTGDGVSALPDPSFIARPGETNRVTLLIGKAYHVTSRMPIACVGQSSAEIEVWQDSPKSLSFLWPVTIEAVGMRDGLSFAMTVTPNCLGGGFSWTNSCCSISSSGWTFTYSCNGTCHCTGCCALGCYTYESFSLPASGGSCGCSAEGGPDIGGTNEPPVSARVSVSFSQKVLFYEDEYVNSLGVIMPAWSDEMVTLLCSVSGGSRGGVLRFQLNNMDKLAWQGGDVLPSAEFAVAAGELYSWQAVYGFAAHSYSENDVTATATFTENFSGDSIEVSDSMTVVMLGTVAAATWPTNMVRRTFGVAENVCIYKTPNIAATAVASQGVCTNSLLKIDYYCPHEDCSDSITISYKGCDHTMDFDILAPSGYSVINIHSNIFAAAGQSGGFEMQFSTILLPRHVSFSNLEIVELPRIANDASGYYDQLSKTNQWDHGLHGAGVWVGVEAGNRVSDTATMEINNPPWLDGGSFTWPIPNAWRVKNDVNVTNIFCNTDQRFELDASGTARLLKFGCVGERATNGVYRSWRTN